MEKNLTSYIKVYKSVIPPDMCKNTVAELEEKNWSEHTFYNPITKLYYSNANEPRHTYEQVSYSKNLMDIIWQQIEQYVLRDFNFPWWNSWQGFNQIKFNKYDETSTMSLHCDHIHDMFDGERKGIPILTVIGLLNSEFSGGELTVLEDSLDLEVGDIVIFPSLFLYPHIVTPITKGTRYSFASWVW